MLIIIKTQKSTNTQTCLPLDLFFQTFFVSQTPLLPTTLQPDIDVFVLFFIGINFLAIGQFLLPHPQNFHLPQILYLLPVYFINQLFIFITVLDDSGSLSKFFGLTPHRFCCCFRTRNRQLFLNHLRHWSNAVPFFDPGCDSLNILLFVRKVVLEFIQLDFLSFSDLLISQKKVNIIQHLLLHFLTMQKFPKSFPQNPIPATNKCQRTQYFLLILLHITKNIARSQLENDPGYQLPHPHIGRTYTLLKWYKMMHIHHRLPLQSQKYII